MTGMYEGKFVSVCSTGVVMRTDSNIYLKKQPLQAQKEALYMLWEEQTIVIALNACVLLVRQG